jgi:hypothetical protein
MLHNPHCKARNINLHAYISDCVCAPAAGKQRRSARGRGVAEEGEEEEKRLSCSIDKWLEGRPRTIEASDTQRTTIRSSVEVQETPPPSPSPSPSPSVKMLRNRFGEVEREEGPSSASVSEKQLAR